MRQLVQKIIFFLLVSPAGVFAQTVELWIDGGVSLSSKFCEVTASLKNLSQSTIDVFPKLNLYDRSNYLISSSAFIFQGVRPGYTVSSTNVFNVGCNEIRHILFRGIEGGCSVGEKTLNPSECPIVIRLPKNRGVIDIQK